MIIKLCYGPGRTYTVSEISHFEYVNHRQSSVVFDSSTSQLFTVEDDGNLQEVTEDYSVCVSQSALQDLTPLQGDSAKYFVNICTLYNTNTQDWEQYAFSGIGYLCDNNGKTVDVLK